MLETCHTVCHAKWDSTELVETPTRLEGCVWLAFDTQWYLMVSTTKVNGAVDVVLSNLADCVVDTRGGIAIK